MSAQRQRYKILCAVVALALCLCCFGGLAQAGSHDLTNINTASVQELQELKGIGKAISERIVEYREEQEFEQKEDIMEVKGIGSSTFEDIKDQISVGDH
ncbi:MAG: ComEA family DNA-binding protein [Thermodesulfobacteriota bacterium]